MNGKKAKRIRREAKEWMQILKPAATERTLYKFLKDIHKGKDMESAKYHLSKRVEAQAKNINKQQEIMK